MKVFVEKTLVESIDLNSCSADVFFSEDKAREAMFANIDEYAEEYGGDVIERYNRRCLMQSGDEYVTIEIEEVEVK